MRILYGRPLMRNSFRLVYGEHEDFFEAFFSFIAMMPNCQVQILCKTSSAKIHQSENVRRGSCVEAPIAAKMGALHLVLIEEHVEGGYNGVGPHAQLLREVLLAHDHRSARELSADGASVVHDLVRAHAQFFSLFLLDAFLPRGFGFENSRARRGHAHSRRHGRGKPPALPK